MKSAREAVGPLREAATPEAIDAATDAALAKPGEPIVRFLKNYGGRAIPSMVGFYAGSELTDGGMAGSLVGTGVGGIAGAVMGNPGTAFRNVINNPALRKAFWSTFQAAPDKILTGMGRYGPVLQRELHRYGVEGAMAVDEALSDDPEYAEAKLRVLQDLEAGASP